METIAVHVEKSGRILIPAAIRRKLNLHPGSEVLLQVDDTGIRIGTREQMVSRTQDRLRRYVPTDRLLSEELIQERRAEAAREEPS